ncbi:exonuclease SbcCD subunit D [Amphibacillus jilinensis]|uniref:exonuclease SbcCD subunit D n=1 Tax=Amphibacillus jilinensis TaxID=1216008 RepID=UPI0002F52D68|nr:exonuclease SbcCD subunit D [Amphibacillus jilinensis]
MRILHTADWHLGKLVNNVYMTEDQSYILDQFFEIINDQKPDVIIIAGDIYDRSIPPKEAVDLLDQTFTRLITDYSTPVLVTSGNHDSPDRLHFGSRLFRKNQLFIESKITLPVEHLTFTDQQGPVNFYLIPYFEPADIKALFPNHKIQSHQDAMAVIVQSIEARLNKQERHVCIAHAFLAGGMASESEDRLSMIGGNPYVDVDIFNAFDYVALGHLHQPQRVKRDTVQYSGSLLKYSFSEARQQKSVTIIDLVADKQTKITRVPLTPRREMRIIEGYFEQLISDAYYKPSDDYVQICLLDDGQVLDPVSQLRKKFPNILRLERKVKQSNQRLEQLLQVKEKQHLSHQELFHNFYKEIKGEAIPEAREKMINEIIEQLMLQKRRQ